jgi:hypothetical protein
VMSMSSASSHCPARRCPKSCFAIACNTRRRCCLELVASAALSVSERSDSALGARVHGTESGLGVREREAARPRASRTPTSDFVLCWKERAGDS